MSLPRLELTEDPTQKNDFIIFRRQIDSKKVPTFSKKTDLYVRTKKGKTSIRPNSRAFVLKNKTKKHKRTKSIFNIF
jgi:hypothetical protein